jgi:tripartite-type tricarboxylate transporter receptor subunit TctC
MNTHHVRRHTSAFFVAAGLVGVSAVAATAAAQSYPERPIRLIVTSTPGSGPDVLARFLGDRLTPALGQQIVVDTRPGAAGTIGADVVSRATPDGYTLMIMTAQHVIASSMYGNLKYDLQRDFASISLIGTVPFLLLVNPEVPAKSIEELIRLAKSRPGEFRYGSGGAGSPPHLSAAIFTHMTGTRMLHVPYKGVTPALNDTIAGQVHLVFAVIPAAMPMVKADRVRVLGITTQKRSPLLPDVPSISEAVPGYEMIGWYGLTAPTGTPEGILARLGAEIVKVVKEPKFHQQLVLLGTEPVASSRREFDAFRQAETKKLGEALKVSGAQRE